MQKNFEAFGGKREKLKLRNANSDSSIIKLQSYLLRGWLNA